VSRKLLGLTLALSAWVTGTVAGSLASAPSAGAAPLLVVGRAHANYLPSLDSDKPIFVLVLGSDARPGTPMDHGLSDSIHILGINPAAHRATVYGIPRDSWVPLATGGTGKINSAMPAGGPEKEIETVENVTGIHFDYYALTGFNELVNAVDALDGIKINIPYTVVAYDRTLPAGEQTLNGRSALAYARTRHSLPLGDFDRSLNQGRLMLAALENFRSDFAKDPTQLFSWLSAGLRNVQTSLSIDELNRFAFLATQIKPKNVTNLVALGRSQTIGGTSAVSLSSENQPLWQDLAADGYILQKDIPHAAQPSPT
jgi:polyisoprenyl-teichoic acid--peptidoglycan teichoic acid transferase